MENTNEELKNINNENDCEFENMEGMQYLATIRNETIDLILTDPPYIISRETGMNIHYNKVKHHSFCCY